MRFLKELFLHRLRDIDAALRSNTKTQLIKYVILRQALKLIGIKEEYFSHYIPSSISSLYGYKFFTRKNTLDFLFVSKYYEPDTTKFIRELNGEIFFDIGAHIGRYSILCSKNFKKIYSFEPESDNFRILKLNIRLNNLRNVFPINVAISNKNGYQYILRPGINTGVACVNEREGIPVKTIKLDDFVRKNKIKESAIRIIKIDVEKSERKVIEGMKRILIRGNPILIVEGSLEMIRYLSNYGYKCKKLLDKNNYLFAKEYQCLE